MVKYRSEEIFAALGSPIRRQMTERLAKEGRKSVTDLAQPFAMSLPAALKHMAILEESGLVVSTKEGRVRYYAMNPQALADGMSWFMSMERLWEGRFDRLEDYLAQTDDKNKT
jgi:DNA-binding transcriptional ArsR family regulator